eukprot:2902188-Pleurochrysis_carterae.AAC.1
MAERVGADDQKPASGERVRVGAEMHAAVASCFVPIAIAAPKAATLSRIDSMAHAENGCDWRAVERTSAECAFAGEFKSPAVRADSIAGAAASREESCSRAESSSLCIAVSASRAESSSRCAVA